MSSFGKFIVSFISSRILPFISICIFMTSVLDVVYLFSQLFLWGVYFLNRDEAAAIQQMHRCISCPSPNKLLPCLWSFVKSGVHCERRGVSKRKRIKFWIFLRFRDWARSLRWPVDASVYCWGEVLRTHFLDVDRSGWTLTQRFVLRRLWWGDS